MLSEGLHFLSMLCLLGFLIPYLENDGDKEFHQKKFDELIYLGVTDFSLKNLKRQEKDAIDSIRKMLICSEESLKKRVNLLRRLFGL